MADISRSRLPLYGRYYKEEDGEMIRVLIAEDDLPCFRQIEQFISDYSLETGRAFHITHYDNGEDLVEKYKPNYDLLLLDVGQRLCSMQ